MHHTLNPKKSQFGTTLIEVIVATAILMITVMIVSRHFTTIIYDQKFLRLQRVRDDIAARVNAALADPMNWALQQNFNPAIRNCLARDTTATPGACNDQPQIFDFRALDPMRNIADPGGDARANEMFLFGGSNWGTQGQPECIGTVDQCPFEVRTVMRPAIDPGGVGFAESFSALAFVSLRQRAIPADAPASFRRLWGAAFRSEPPLPVRFSDIVDLNALPWAYSQTIDSRRILAAAEANCPPGQVMVGNDKFGFPICECINQDARTANQPKARAANQLTPENINGVCSPICTQNVGGVNIVRGVRLQRGSENLAGGLADVTNRRDASGNLGSYFCFATGARDRTSFIANATNQGNCPNFNASNPTANFVERRLNQRYYASGIEIAPCRYIDNGKDGEGEVECDDSLIRCSRTPIDVVAP